MSEAHPQSAYDARQALHGTQDIYSGVIPRGTVRRFTDVLPLYQRLKQDGFDPCNACEVGSWAGYSALAFAQTFAAPIVCVDTWLGSEEHWTQPDAPQHAMHRTNGRPRLYEEFLESTHACRNWITPLPLPSNIAARVLAHHGFKFDLIYLDGDHSKEGVQADIGAYWPLLAEGGMMIGDDYSDPRFGVKEAVLSRFGMDAFDRPYEVVAGNWWIVRKD